MGEVNGQHADVINDKTLVQDMTHEGEDHTCHTSATYYTHILCISPSQKHKSTSNLEIEAIHPEKKSSHDIPFQGMIPIEYGIDTHQAVTHAANGPHSGPASS